MEGDPQENISRLESEIEALAESAERCRKIALFAKAAVGAGAVLLGAILFGIVRADALMLMLSAIGILGGIVLSGSNATTANQIAERIAQAEATRAGMISGMELTLVPDAVPSRLLH